MRSGEMMSKGTAMIAALAALAAALFAVPALADTTSTIRGGGVQVLAPDGWSDVVPAASSGSADPRTLLVVGTRGARAIETRCQVASYRVPSDGAVVVVIGWRDSVDDKPALQLSKLRRPTFECFAGRGAVGQVTRRGRDFQVNVMVGDSADADTIAAALAVARSFQLVPRKTA